ncbi:Syntaxin-1A, partial [Orchesella cincta]
MSRDRLAEFYQKAKITGEEESQPSESVMLTNINDGLENAATVIEMPESDEDDIQKIFMEVSDTTRMIEDLTTDVEKVKSLHSKILASAISDQQMKADLDDSDVSNQNQLSSDSGKIERYEEANFQAEEEDKGSASVRIRKIQHSALQQSFIDAMYQYQFCTKLLSRKSVKHGSSDKYRLIIMETKQAKQMLEDVEARHKDILKLEQSLTDLHGLFSELAMLVETQDFVVNNIAASVLSTEDYVAKAKTETKKAQEFQQKVRK